MENKSPELEVAIKAALEAGKILEKHQETEIERGVKEDKSMVTLADTESEEVIKKIISENFPDHSIVGEETDAIKGTSLYTWYVDPVDGSRNFAHKIPFFAVSIALLQGDDILVGVVYNPVTRSLFYAEKGKGAYLNDKKIHVSKANRDKCIVTVAVGRNSSQVLRRNLLHYLPENVVASVRDFGCTALDLAHIARGSTEADIKMGFKTYDAASGILLVTEAGGIVTGIDGNEWKLADEGSFIASNGIFHDILIEEVKKQKEKLGLE
ncbi:MAG: inositol monophosphatase family protein [Candidatus Paceibacterota bacterium]